MKKIKKILNKFNKTKLKVMLFITGFLFIGVLIINIFGVTYSRYESNAEMYADADVAYFIVDAGTYDNSITLSGLYPRTEPFLYTINVQNYKDLKRTNVNLKYHVTLKTTTNLPLTFQMVRNEVYTATATNILTSNEILTESNVYYKYFYTTNDYNFGYTQNQTDQYTIAVYFPLSYKDSPDLYEGKIDLISFIIDAEQVV